MQRGFRYLRGQDDWLEDLIGKPVNFSNKFKRENFQTPVAFFQIYAEKVYGRELQVWKGKVVKGLKPLCLCCGTKPQSNSLTCEGCKRSYHKKCVPFLKDHVEICHQRLCKHKKGDSKRCDYCFRLFCTKCLDEHAPQCFAFCVERMAVPDERAQVCFVCHNDKAKDKHMERVSCKKKGCTPSRWRHTKCAETAGWKQHEQDCGAFVCMCLHTHDEEKNPLSKRCNFCERKICVFSDFDAHEVDCWKSQARDEQTPQVQPLESIVEETDMTMAMGKMSV